MNLGVEEEVPQDFTLVLAQKKFAYRTEGLPGVDREQLKAEILELLFEHDMAAVYESTCAEFGWPLDAGRLAAMRDANAAALAALDAALAAAEATEGEVEVRDALRARADHFAALMDRPAAAAAYDAAGAATAGAGPKMDLALSLARLDMALGRWAAVRAGLRRARALCDGGADWERRNRLRVYEAVADMAGRRLAPAADALLEAVATFTATELMPYGRCVFYAVALATAALGRAALKERVLGSPEVLAAAGGSAPGAPAAAGAKALADALHGARYGAFFRALPGVADEVDRDVFLHAHARHWCREVRAAAYAQFLEAYTTVSLAGMAAAFGVSPGFLDAELADFVAAGRLAARIDRVGGTVESARADARSDAYAAALRQGDALLNKLQRLAKVVEVE